MIVGWLEANTETLTSDILTTLLPDMSLQSARVILQTTLELMSEAPEYAGRIHKRPEGARGGYIPMLFAEDERPEALEDILTLTASQLNDVVRQSPNGLPLGDAIQAITQKRGRKPDFAQVLSAIDQLSQHFGDAFEVVKTGSRGQMTLRFVTAEEKTYSRRNKKVK